MASEAARFQALTVPPACVYAERSLRPDLRSWFAAQFGEPTLAQRYAWPTIASGQHLLLASPTGTGKTLAAFLPIINAIIAERPRAECRALYLAPLKALGRDVKTNLQRCWRSISEELSLDETILRVGLRTGDTSPRVRKRQIQDPPPILLTTPESLAQMLAQPTASELFRHLRHVIVDEVHALVGTKRGADLSISLERLAAMNDRFQRIGLSATCAPVTSVADFLVGSQRACTIAQVNDCSEKQLLIEPLFENLEYSPRWLSALLDRIDAELGAQRTTLIFSNTRSLSERLTWALKRRYPDRAEVIASHHSSLAAARRRLVERQLKQGRMWIVVSSSSLELGVDIGSVDCVIFVHPPGGVVRLLQRVGRSGHRPEQPKRGILLTASSAELLEATVTASSSRAGQLEPVRLIDTPLDVLCQQLVGMAMTGLWSPTAAFDLVRQAAPYRDLSWDDFRDCLDYLSGRLRDGTTWLPSRLHWEDNCFTIADSRTARLLRRNLGTITTEDACAIRLRIIPEDGAEPETRAIGEVDELYAERLKPGDRFVLDGRCLEVKERDGAGLIVDEVFGQPATPRWLGTGVPMSAELARRIYLFRVQASETLRDGDAALASWLAHEFQLGDVARTALGRYLLEQETISEVPPLTTLLVESVAMPSCVEYFIHTPLARSANETLVRVLMQRLEQASDAGKAVAADLGIYLIAFTSEPITPDRWRQLLSIDEFDVDFAAQLHASELLPLHFTKIAQTGLMVLRNPAGRKRKVGGRDWTARQLYDQIRARVADFVLLRQTEREAASSLCDLPTARAFVVSLPSMTIHVRHLAQPSPLGASLLAASMEESSRSFAGTSG